MEDVRTAYQIAVGKPDRTCRGMDLEETRRGAWTDLIWLCTWAFVNQRFRPSTPFCTKICYIKLVFSSWDVRFSRRRVWRWPPSGIQRPDDGRNTHLWNVCLYHRSLSSSPSLSLQTSKWTPQPLTFSSSWDQQIDAAASVTAGQLIAATAP
jgi:hypothetical protein